VPPVDSRLTAGTLLFLLVAACASREPLASTTAGLQVDTIATTLTVPFQALAGGTILPDGRVALADAAAGQVWLLAPDGGPPATLGQPGSGPGQLNLPRGVALYGDTIAVLNAGNRRIELFGLDGATLGSRDLAPDLLTSPVELLANGQMLSTTLGRDSSLARVVRADGAILQRYGTALASSPDNLNPATLLATIRAGEVPEVFRNVVLPVGAPSGDVWLVLHTEGLIRRFDPSGTMAAEAVLPEEEVAPLRAEFFRANADEANSGRLVAYLIASAGVADATGAWFLLAPGPASASVLLQIGNDGQMGERLVVKEGAGARLLLRDTASGTFYLINQEAGVVVRVRRP